MLKRDADAAAPLSACGRTIGTLRDSSLPICEQPTGPWRQSSAAAGNSRSANWLLRTLQRQKRWLRRRKMQPAALNFGATKRAKPAHISWPAYLIPICRRPNSIPIDYPDFYRGLVAEEAVRPHIPNPSENLYLGAVRGAPAAAGCDYFGLTERGHLAGSGRSRALAQPPYAPRPRPAFPRGTDRPWQHTTSRSYLVRRPSISRAPKSSMVIQPCRRDGCCGYRPFSQDSELKTSSHRRDLGCHGPAHVTSSPGAQPIARPEPRPPLALRPRRLSVSGIETWIANPYALFAERILKLDALPPLGQDPDASLRGTIVHEALGRFAQEFPNSLPDDPATELLAIAETLFAELGPHPRIAAFWHYRFSRFADWFSANEARLRKDATLTLGEVAGLDGDRCPGRTIHFDGPRRQDRHQRDGSLDHGLQDRCESYGAGITRQRRQAPTALVGSADRQGCGFR